MTLPFLRWVDFYLKKKKAVGLNVTWSNVVTPPRCVDQLASLSFTTCYRSFSMTFLWLPSHRMDSPCSFPPPCWLSLIILLGHFAFSNYLQVRSVQGSVLGPLSRLLVTPRNVTHSTLRRTPKRTHQPDPSPKRPPRRHGPVWMCVLNRFATDATLS